jgi:hypothetical protein
MGIRRASVLQALGLALLALLLMGPDFYLRGGIYAALDIMSVSLPWAALNKAPWLNPLITDPATQYLPWRQFVYETLRAGQWPLWNPYIFSGHPTFGSINEQVFYLPNMLFAPWPAERGFGPLAFLHLALAGIGARAFARLHVDDDAAATLAGVAAMLGGPLIAWLQYPALSSTIAWAGAIFYFLELTLRRRRVVFALLCGISIGLCLLAGMTQYSLYLLIVVAAYALVRLAVLRSLLALALAALAGVVGGGIGAVAYLPALELAPQAHRAQLTLELLRESALPLPYLAVYLLPNAYGSPTRGDYMGPFNYIEATSYLGLLPLLLVALLLVTRPRSATVWLFALIGVTLGLIQFGWTPLMRLVDALPPFNYFVLNRVVGLLPFLVGVVAAASYGALPADKPRVGWLRTSAIVVLAAALGAAVLWAGQGQLARSGPDRYARRDVAVALGLLGLGAAALVARVWLPRRGPVAWLAPAVLAADLLLFGAGYNPVVLTNPAAGPPPEPLTKLPTGPMAPRALGLQIERYVFGPNLGMLWDIPVADGYVSQYLVRYREFVIRAAPEKPVPWLKLFTNLTTFSQIRAPYVDLLGVKYVLTTPSPLVPDSLRPAAGARSESIFGQRTVGALFRPRQNGLNRIDVYPSLAGGRAPAWLALHLKRDPTTPDHMSYVRIDNPQIKDGEPLTFYFNPIPDSAGRQLYFYLDAPEASAEQAIALRLTEEPYPGERRLVDDRPAPGALRFATYAVPLAGWREVAQANEVALYENPNALERAYVVHSVRQLEESAFYAALDDGSLDPRRTAAVHAAPPGQFAELAAAPPSERTPAEVVVADALTVTLRVAPTRPGLLVVSNSFYDGWRATVDGASTPVERVDAVLQGVYLAPGQHEVRLRFEPRSVKLGLAAASAGLGLGVLALAAEALIRRRRRPAAPR